MKSSTKLTTFDRDMGADVPIEAPSLDFDGPVPKSDRRITDPLSILFLLSAWGYFIFVGVWSMRNGNPDAILHPHDYKGRLCGVSRGRNGKVLPPLWAPVDVLGNGVCVDACPSGESNFAPADRLDLHCKDDADLLEIEACLGDNGEVVNDPNALIACGGCMFQLETVPSRSNYFCQPKSTMGVLDEINTAAANAGHSDFLMEYKLFQNMPPLWRYVQGVVASKHLVLGLGLGGAAFLGLVYMFLLQIPCTIAATVWISTFLVPMIFSCGGYLFYTMAQDYDLDYSPGVQGLTKPKAIKFLAICIWVVSGLTVGLIAGLRRRIQHFISIARAAADSTRDVKVALLSPFVQFFGFLVFFLPWASFLINLASTGKSVQRTSEIFDGVEITSASYEYSKLTVNMFWFLVFIFLWTSEFIISMGRITLNMIFAKWYFTPDKEDSIEMSFLSALWLTTIDFVSVRQLTTKHFGTAAFGSLVTGPIQIIRTPIIWTQSFIKKFRADGSCISFLICSCQCCLFSLERFFKFASKDSYVYTSLLGFSFCKGSHNAFYMVGRNADSGAVEGIYNERNLLFCKFCIVAITTTATLLGMDRSGDEFFVVGTATLTVAIVSWFIVGIFVELCASAILTMLHCYLVDDEVFEHDDVTIFAPEQLLLVLTSNESKGDDENDNDDNHEEEEDIEKGLAKEICQQVQQEPVSVEVEEEEIAEADSEEDESTYYAQGVRYVATEEEAEDDECNDGVASASADVLSRKSEGSADAPSATAGGNNKSSLLDQMHTEEDDETADIPIIDGWTMDDLSRLVGSVSNHPVYADGDIITTSPMSYDPTVAAEVRGVVTTDSGSQYRLGRSKEVADVERRMAQVEGFLAQERRVQEAAEAAARVREVADVLSL